MRRSYWSVLLFSLFFVLFAFSRTNQNRNDVNVSSTEEIKNTINRTLDSFNLAAAHADFTGYFNFFTEDGIFTGTDATERWEKKEFMIWARPYFDRGRAWNFKTLGRNISLDRSGRIAWFDELLDTQMKICRGSGVMVKQYDGWKLKQYILSATVPNSIMDEVVKMKAPQEDSLISKLRK